MPHRLDKDHFVHGAFTIKGGRLTFRCGSGQLSYYAQQAKLAGRDFTVHLTPPEGAKEFTGKVASVKLVEGIKPLQYEIVMLEHAPKAPPRKR